MSIKIIGLDLDGTTLGINGKLPPINKIAIERAIDAGINIVVTTGRVISAVPEDIMNISGLRYIISSNGAHVRDLKQGHDVYSSFIEPDVIGRVVDLARERNLYLEAFSRWKSVYRFKLYIMTLMLMEAFTEGASMFLGREIHWMIYLDLCLITAQRLRI